MLIATRVVILDIIFMPRYSFFKRGLSQPGVGGRGPVVPVGNKGSVDHAGDGRGLFGLKEGRQLHVGTGSA